MKINKFGNCPECGSSWKGEEIFSVFRKQSWTIQMSDVELMDYIIDDYSPPYYFSRLIGHEDPTIYDGICEWVCPDCDARFSRF